MKAEINGILIAESEETVVVEGNHYFPAQSVNHDYLSDNSLETGCPWKGTAKYYDITVDGQTTEAVAWYYPTPKEAASEIKDYIAFYPQVSVTE